MTTVHPIHVDPAFFPPSPPGPASTVPMAAVEVAAWLDVSPLTVASWRKRGVMPAPRWVVAGRKAVALWTREDLEPWARATGRLIDPTCPTCGGHYNVMGHDPEPCTGYDDSWSYDYHGLGFDI